MHAAPVLTRADLDALPDDNLRHELIDGAFIMTPAPGISHQCMAGSLFVRLRSALAGSHLLALMAPLDVVLGDNVVEPDILVAPRAAFTERDLPTAPLLVVEVRSPSTARLDRGRKLSLYEEFGVPHYWLLDPREPSATILKLIDGRYAETAHAIGDQTVTIGEPFSLSFTPADLLRD
jgi:Uma2 family endonuclease